MTRGVLLFVGWCLLVLGGLGAAAWGAWDPYADGGGHHSGPAERSRHHGGGGFGYWGFSHE